MVEEILGTLSGLLHVGNLEFGEGEVAQLQSEADIVAACEQLKCQRHDVEKRAKPGGGPRRGTSGGKSSFWTGRQPWRSGNAIV